MPPSPSFCRILYGPICSGVGIGSLGNNRDSTPLIDALRYDPSQIVRHEATVALAEIGGEDALSVLEAATEDRDPVVSASARFAIQSILSYRDQGLRAFNE